MTINFSTQALPLGQTIIGPTNVVDNTNIMAIQLVRTALPDTGSILADMWIDVSQDNGLSWRQLCGTGIIGGTNIFPKTGSANLLSTFFPSLPFGKLMRVRLFAYTAFTLSGLSMVTS